MMARADRVRRPELRQEREQVEAAITMLERWARGRGKQRERLFLGHRQLAALGRVERRLFPSPEGRPMGQGHHAHEEHRHAYTPPAVAANPPF